MSHIAKMTLIGQYRYHSDLFEYLTLPEAIDKETFIDTLMTVYGEFPTIYPNPDYMKWFIGLWGRKSQQDLLKISQALLDDYNPLHNYDRYEEYTDNVENGINTSGTSENQVSAYNVNTYQPDNKTITNGETSGTEDRTHSGHLYGNIGVTTSQQMLEAELKLRAESNLYNIVTGLLAKEICIMVY